MVDTIRHGHARIESAEDQLGGLDKACFCFHLTYRVFPKKCSTQHKKLDTLYSEIKHLLDLKLWQQRVLMSIPCSQSLRSNKCVISEYKVLNFLC